MPIVPNEVPGVGAPAWASVLTPDGARHQGRRRTRRRDYVRPRGCDRYVARRCHYDQQGVLSENDPLGDRR